MELSSWSAVVSNPFLVVLIVTSGLLNLPRAAGTNCNTRLSIIPDIEISTSPPTKKLAIGTAINLTCLAQPRGVDAEYYDRWTEYIQWYDPKGKPVGHRCVQDRQMVLKHRCTLMLKHLTAEQVGSYTCEAGNGYRAHCRRKFVEIRSKETQTIQIIEDPKNQSALIGSIVTFNCTATGNPGPTISWEKNDDPYALQTNPRVEEKVIVLENKVVRSQLLLIGTKMEDNGKYHCVANNSAEERISRVSFLDLKSESRTLAGRTGLTIFQLTVIAFVVSTFVFAVGAFLWDRRPKKISKSRSIFMSRLQKSESPSHV